MTLPDKLIKQLVANLASCDTHYLFTITTKGITIAEEIIRKTLEDYENEERSEYLKME